MKTILDWTNAAIQKPGFSRTNTSQFSSQGLELDLQRIFDYISRYTPQDVDLNPEVRPFIPDLIPAIGDIDAFVKIDRPDARNDFLGQIILDEPAALQSDPAGILGS